MSGSKINEFDEGLDVGNDGGDRVVLGVNLIFWIIKVEEGP